MRMSKAVDADRKDTRRGAGNDHRTELATRLRYRVFFVLPDAMEGRCELQQDAPISPAEVGALEQVLMDRLGCGNALVIGWQRLAPSAAADAARIA